MLISSTTSVYLFNQIINDLIVDTTSFDNDEFIVITYNNAIGQSLILSAFAMDES